MDTKFKFDMSDGTHVEFDCNDKFMRFVREKLELSEFEEITPEHIKLVFTRTIEGALEG